MPVYFGNNKMRPSGIKLAYSGNSKVFELFIYKRYLPYAVVFYEEQNHEYAISRYITLNNVPFLSDLSRPTSIPIIKHDGIYQFDFTNAGATPNHAMQRSDERSKYFEINKSFELRTATSQSDVLQYDTQFGFVNDIRYYSIREHCYISGWKIESNVKGEYVDEYKTDQNIADGIYDFGDGEYYYEKIIQ